ncbi:MAG: hypothetical protein F6J93_15195 [Oscillatoria sp. SIO1A7]|nr:hypothetical protein [Oscillatoria sp. SIO1A7]
MKCSQSKCLCTLALSHYSAARLFLPRCTSPMPNAQESGQRSAVSV